MTFTETGLPGSFVIRPELREDERGFFARIWCAKEFEEHGLNPRLAQCSISYNRLKGTLRGMHYQAEPYREAKLIRCVRGSIYDVLVDLRPDSPAYKRHFGVVLDPCNRNMLYVPEGCAHGFITLQDDSEIVYHISEFYAPEASRGFRWNDPAFDIRWPGDVEVISERDRNYPDYSL